MKYVVYIECDDETLKEGGYLAHIPAIPGCVGRGLTKKEAVARCEETLRSYLALLIHAGVSGVPRETDKLDVEVRECTGSTFPSDYNPLMPNETEQLVQWMEVSRDEMLETVAGLPPAALDWKPNPNIYSIREILNHIANADWWYVQRLKFWPNDVYQRLAATRDLLSASLRSLNDDDRGRVTVHYGEEWTPRKVARRALEHEREHLIQIRELAERYAREELS
jgi:predicted RNase H-like HicB family nuclease